MKIKLHFKTPDVMDQLEEQIKMEMTLPEDADETTLEEHPAEVQAAIADAKEKLAKFIKYSECVEIEFDLNDETAEVQEV